MRTKATLIGAIAILLWSALAALAAASGTMPPFQLAAITFAIGGAIGVLSWIPRKTSPRVLVQPARVWLLGVGGLFGYHALYFIALRTAAPAEVSLLNYLWPLLIVVMSAMLPGERLAGRALIGALLGFAATIVVVAGSGAVEVDPTALKGYAAAGAAGIVWASYSVASRRFADVPSDTVAGFCLATAALSAIAHMLVEPTVWPASQAQWLCIIALGLGPVGAAFYVWDHGMKHGNIKLLGTLAYATPILSTGWLIVSGYAKPTRVILLSCFLIVMGSIIATSDSDAHKPEVSR